MNKHILFILLIFTFFELKAQHVLIKKPVKQNTETASFPSNKVRTNNTIEDKTIRKKGNIEPTMIYVQGGSFAMGNNEGDADEKPVHTVYLNSFYIGKYEITQAQWEAIMGYNPSEYQSCPNCPVHNMSWDEIQEFLQKLNAQTGKQYRLPTEAEWEYAARGGNKSKGYIYSGSDNLESVAWYVNNGGLHSVGKKQANELGIYDMTGNVREWCSDWYDKNYYQISPSNNPTGPSKGTYRVLRGESYGYISQSSSVATRNNYPPEAPDFTAGFRVVLIP